MNTHQDLSPAGHSAVASAPQVTRFSWTDFVELVNDASRPSRAYLATNPQRTTNRRCFMDSPKYGVLDNAFLGNLVKDSLGGSLTLVHDHDNALVPVHQVVIEALNQFMPRNVITIGKQAPGMALQHWYPHAKALFPRATADQIEVNLHHCQSGMTTRHLPNNIFLFDAVPDMFSATAAAMLAKRGIDVIARMTGANALEMCNAFGALLPHNFDDGLGTCQRLSAIHISRY